MTMKEEESPDSIKLLTCSIIIHAPIDLVWQAVTKREYYRLWAKCFKEGSTFEGEFIQNSKVMFFAEDDREHQMESTITDLENHEYICIRHDDWDDALEEYFFDKIDDTTTEFTIEMDCWEDYYDMLYQSWLEAIQELKKVAESLL